MSVRLDLAWNEIQQARGYLLRMLEGLRDEEWFKMPEEGVTHIGWQVGHLTMSQYRLCLERIRDARPEDAALLTPNYFELFGKGTRPLNDPSAYPSPDELRAALDRVFAQVQTEVPAFRDADLDSAVLKPHAFVKTKLESLFWSAAHERIHSGQIGLLRRLLGHAPQW